MPLEPTGQCNSARTGCEAINHGSKRGQIGASKPQDRARNAIGKRCEGLDGRALGLWHRLPENRNSLPMRQGVHSEHTAARPDCWQEPARSMAEQQVDCFWPWLLKLLQEGIGSIRIHVIQCIDDQRAPASDRR
jgi:hypothetical protein